MLSILIYILMTGALSIFGFLYYRELRKPKRDQIEVAIFLGLLFFLGLLTSINIYRHKPVVEKVQRDAFDDAFSSVERIIVDQVPENRVQLTIVSAASDSTYTVIISKKDAKKLYDSLKEQ